ncbi:MAG: hypothetical protein P8Y25_11020, partial [Chromatiaceae bacterium]
MEFLEDTAAIGRRDPLPPVPDLDPEPTTATAATDKNAPLPGMADGVRDQIVKDPLQQVRIGVQGIVAAEEPDVHPPVGGERLELVPYLVQEDRHEKILLLRNHDPRIELADIEQRVQEP